MVLINHRGKEKKKFKFDGVMVLCYWAHCRRYFERALKHDKERAEYGMEQIGMQYSVETISPKF